VRKIIAALVVSLDGYIEGSQGEIDWIDSWEDPSEITQQVDTCILGAGMYPGYEQYWTAVHNHTGDPLPFSDKLATPGETAYADFAMRTPHVVLSTQMKTTAWKNTRIVRSVQDIRLLKQQPGKDMHAVGGGALVSSLVNAGLVDELRLVAVPILLGAGKALFQGLAARHNLQLQSTALLPKGHVRLDYRMA
jgi:dihydrofolate reductase